MGPSLYADFHASLTSEKNIAWVLKTKHVPINVHQATSPLAVLIFLANQAAVLIFLAVPVLTVLITA